MPQGSVLGPGLYPLFTADLPNTVFATFGDDIGRSLSYPKV